MDGKTDTVREALEECIAYIQATDAVNPMESLARGEGYSIEAQPLVDKICKSIAAISAIGPEAIRPSEDTEKLCHQIYDVLSISPALKLLDDGKLYALVTAHDEAVRRECAEKAIDYIDKTYESIDRVAIRASILSAKSAQDERKEVDHADE